MKKFRFGHRWIWLGGCVSLLLAILFTCFYDSFKQEANANMDSPLESVENMNYMYQNCYVLYRDLYNRQNQTDMDFHELYLKPLSGYEAYGNEEYLRELEQQKETEPEASEALESTGTEITEAGENAGYAANEIAELSLWDIQNILQTLDNVDGHFQNLENNFSQLNQMFDYIIEDTKTGEYVSNLTSQNISMDDQFFYVSFLFDEYGNVSVDNTVRGSDVTRIRKNASEVIRSSSMENIVEECVTDSTFYKELFQTAMPVNCRVTFCISNADWNQMMGENGDMLWYAYLGSGGYYTVSMVTQYEAYRQTYCGTIYLFFLLGMAVLSFLLPAKLVEHPWRDCKLCKIPLEVLYVICLLLIALGSWVVRLVMWINCGDARQLLSNVFPIKAAVEFSYCLNFLALGVLFFGAWYVGLCLRTFRELGIKETIKQRLLLYRIFPYVKSKLLAIYEAVEHFDVTRNAKRLILKIVLLNAVILFLISSLWMGGLTVAIIYSVILYFVLRKYISNLQKRYSILLKATNEIAQGNLNVTIPEDLGVFEPFKPQIIRIQEGFKKAVEEELKSQRMKSELITNVSHDLKTPLTAIITYINLLKEENITQEQRREYLQTLERKSLRLKVLIEDLFEVSKATSKNITLNIMDVDVINLVKQVAFEMSDKLNTANLDVRMTLPGEKVIVPLDSQKTYRIFENLFGNIAKYSMPGTRVYVNGTVQEEGVEITLKNITAEEIHVTPEELTERFVRGDASRNTEGSGLGLAIAKSFTELQGGKFSIQMDGDLFKVTVFWKCTKTEGAC